MPLVELVGCATVEILGRPASDACYVPPKIDEGGG
jgi:hypothetical protein